MPWKCWADCPANNSEFDPAHLLDAVLWSCQCNNLYVLHHDAFGALSCAPQRTEARKANISHKRAPMDYDDSMLLGVQSYACNFTILDLQCVRQASKLRPLLLFFITTHDGNAMSMLIKCIGPHLELRCRNTRVQPAVTCTLLAPLLTRTPGGSELGTKHIYSLYSSVFV